MDSRVYSKLDFDLCFERSVDGTNHGGIAWVRRTLEKLKTRTVVLLSGYCKSAMFTMNFSILDHLC